MLLVEMYHYSNEVSDAVKKKHRNFLALNIEKNIAGGIRVKWYLVCSETHSHQRMDFIFNDYN